MVKSGGGSGVTPATAHGQEEGEEEEEIEEAEHAEHAEDAM